MPLTSLLKSLFPKILAWTITLLIAWIVLSPGLVGGFFFDDASNIIKNGNVHVVELTVESLHQSINGPAAGPLGRPVSVLSFAITHFFFGLDPYSFKAINLILHLSNGLLVGWLISLLLRSPKIDITPGLRNWLPIWISAVWLIHPINILPVMLAVQRMTLMATLFLLLALISHLKAVAASGKKKWLGFGIAWLFFWSLAIFSKETGLLFPLFVLVISFFLFEHRTLEGRVFLWGLIGLLLGMGLAAISYLGWDWLNQAYTVRTFSLPERLMTEARVLWFYTAQIIAPRYSEFGIYLDDFSISKSLFDPLSTIISVSGWAIVVLAVYALRKKQPILCLGVTWFLVGHSLESTFLPLEIAHEYRNYMPSMGLILGIGYLGGTSFRKLSIDHKKVFTILVAIIPILILALFTWMRADQMGKPLLSTQIEVSRHPSSSRANYVAAHSLFKAGFGDRNDPIGAQQIRYFFLESAKLDECSKHGHLGLLVWSCASGRPLDTAWTDELANRLERTPFSPGDRKLPQDLLKHLIYMPTCLSREQALGLFESGAKNTKLDHRLRADFYIAAADYELLVSLDPVSGRYYLSQAAELVPQDVQLNEKLMSFSPLN
jgi:protein O-mannosyl-transferase